MTDRNHKDSPHQLKDNSKQGSEDKTTGDARYADERLVYVVPPESLQTDEISLADLWDIVWHGRWLICGITAVFVLSAVAYALIATEWYRADVLLAPAEDRSTQSLTSRLGGLAGLAGLAGIGVGGGDSVESIAVLQSRDFTRSFIEDRNLMPVLLAEDWDAVAGRWKDENPEDHPDVRDAIKYFDENVRVVTKDTQTGLVTLQIEWTDAEIAADWANDLVARLNDNMRQRALKEAEHNVEFLQGELTATNVAALRASAGSLLEMELQKLMLAKGNDEFAFRVVDGAQVPKERERPKRVLIVALAVVIGGAIAILFVFVRHGMK